MKDNNLFDYLKAVLLGEHGKELAAQTRSDILEHARRIAVEIAQSQGDVSIDDVVMLMDQRQLNPEGLKNASGSVFKGKRWQFTGEYLKSSRVKTRGHIIRKWRLTDEYPPPHGRISPTEPPTSTH